MFALSDLAGRIRIRSDLVLSEESALAAIVRSSGDAVISKGVDGVITSWNAGATSVYGHEPDEMLGQSIECMFPAATVGEERARHARVAAGQAESGFRCRRLTAEGKAIEVVMSMSPVRDGKGKVVGVASISRPVSDREEFESRYASLLEATPDGMICVGVDGRITMANARMGDLFGYRPDELVECPVDMLLPTEARARHRRHRAGFAHDPAPGLRGFGTALFARRRDGSTFPVEVSLSTHGVAEKMIVMAAIRDVTSQRGIEAAVRLSEARLRQLAEHVDTVFILRQLNPPAYLYVSPAIDRLTGHKAQDVIDDPALLLGLSRSQDLGRINQYRDASASGLPTQMEIRLVRTDGQIRWVRVSDSPVPNPHGPPERSVTTMEDVTERVEATVALREAEAAARAANDAKNAFLSRMSHELRTPLNAVLGFGQLLEQSLENPEDVTFVRHILTAGRHLLVLINEVLDIARIESGDLSVSLESIDAAAMVAETAQLMHPLADDGNVSIIITVAMSLPCVQADRLRLRQVLLNLMSNAIKYNHPGGHVWISWAEREGRVALTVRDDGRGIAPHLHDRLFVPFDRLGAEITGVEGTGVGLAVTKSLVSLMNGTIRVESSEHGSSFTVTLPAGKPVAPSGTVTGFVPSTATVTPPVRSGSSDTMTVLYIEDNDPNVQVIESLMRLRPGWRLVHAALGRLGLELARAHHPDLVLLDLHLPDLSGLEVLDNLKEDHRTTDIPVVVLSADAGIHQQERLIGAGAAGYLTKPVDLMEVLRLLDGLTVTGEIPGGSAGVGEPGINATMALPR